MTDVPSDTTCFILGQDVEGPDTVLNRFKRLVSLEQQDEDDSVDRERPKEGLRARVDNLSKNICDSESSVTNLVSRFEHLKTEIESLRSKKKQLRSVLTTFDEKLDATSKQDGNNATVDQSVDLEIRQYEDRLALYERALGLSIRRTKGHSNIQVLLRGCCPEDSEILCCLILRPKSATSGSSEDFELVKCSPPIADFQRFLDLFNQTGDFRSFLLVVRHHFVRYFQLRKRLAKRC